MRTVCARRAAEIAFLLLAAASAFAQTANGTITGTVRDPSNAVVAGIKVMVTNTATNLSMTALTSGEGNYTVINLLPGEYRVSVESPGFKKAVTPTLTLLVNQTLRADGVVPLRRAR